MIRRKIDPTHRLSLWNCSPGVIYSIIIIIISYGNWEAHFWFVPNKKKWLMLPPNLSCIKIPQNASGNNLSTLTPSPIIPLTSDIRKGEVCVIPLSLLSFSMTQYPMTSDLWQKGRGNLHYLLVFPSFSLTQYPHFVRKQPAPRW